MTEILFLSVVLVAAFLVALQFSCAISKDSKRISADIASFQSRANTATTLEELTLLKEELNQYYKDNCWHYHYMFEARKVYAHINRRINIHYASFYNTHSHLQ